MKSRIVGSEGLDQRGGDLAPAAVLSFRPRQHLGPVIPPAVHSAEIEFLSVAEADDFNPRQPVPTVGSLQDEVVTLRQQAVVRARALHQKGVTPGTAVDPVMAAPAFEQIIARPTEEGVVA